MEDPRPAQLTVEILVATTERQREVDDRFGVGTVRLFGVFEPID